MSTQDSKEEPKTKTKTKAKDKESKSLSALVNNSGEMVTLQIGGRGIVMNPHISGSADGILLLDVDQKDLPDDAVSDIDHIIENVWQIVPAEFDAEELDTGDLKDLDLVRLSAINFESKASE